MSATPNITPEDATKLGTCIADMAYDLFVELGIESDFCIQSIGRHPVFGGTNRFILTSRGFRAIANSCTKEVLSKFSYIQSR